MSTGAALPNDLRKALGRYVELAKVRPRRVVASTRSAVIEPLADGLDESTGDDDAMWRVMGATVNPGAAATGVGATDGDVFITAPGAVYIWESSLLTFQFGERSGPAKVEFSVFAYFAVRVVKTVRLLSIRHT